MIYIILDINGTLLDRGDPSSASKIRSKHHVEPHVIVHSRPCYFRPFLSEFLDFLFARPCQVGVWTSLRPENTVPIVRSIFEDYLSSPCTLDTILDQEPQFGHLKESLFMVWSQRKCIIRDYGAGLDAHDWKTSKPIMLKNLALLWPSSSEVSEVKGNEEGLARPALESQIDVPLPSAIETDMTTLMDQVRRLAVGPDSTVKWLDEALVTQHGLLPKPKQFPTQLAVQSQLTAKNTLIIEDSPFKCGLQEENGLFIPSYQVQDEKIDTVLCELTRYLRNLLDACDQDPDFDVRDYLKLHSFQCIS